MYVIESLGLLFGKPDHFHAANPEIRLFDHSQNLTGVPVGDSVRFDNCKGLLN